MSIVSVEPLVPAPVVLRFLFATKKKKPMCAILKSSLVNRSQSIPIIPITRETWKWRALFPKEKPKRKLKPVKIKIAVRDARKTPRDPKNASLLKDHNESAREITTDLRNVEMNHEKVVCKNHDAPSGNVNNCSFFR